MNNKLCDSCKGQIGFMYLLTKSGYRCIPCHKAIQLMNKLTIASMPDVKDNPPIDDKYLSGVIARSESTARLLVDKYYEATPSMDDWEN